MNTAPGGSSQAPATSGVEQTLPPFSTPKLRVLVACEYSGAVRRAFRALGHDAWSCDLLDSEDDSPHHIKGDVAPLLGDGWDLMICHPPCTDLSVSGARHFAAKIADGRQGRALDFVRMLLAAPIPHIALENPVSVISSHIRKPDQIIQPWQFGHGETKATCLWLKNLPRLKPTDIVEGREARVHRMPPGPNRWKERSRTFDGIARAMAVQWSAHILNSRMTGQSAHGGSVVSSSQTPPLHIPLVGEASHNSAWGRIGQSAATRSFDTPGNPPARTGANRSTPGEASAKHQSSISATRASNSSLDPCRA